MAFDIRYKSIEIDKEIKLSIDIDFRYKSMTIDLSNIFDYYGSLSEKIVVVLQVNHRHNVVCMVLSSHSIMTVCNRFTIISEILWKQNNSRNAWSFYRSSASAQFVIQEAEEEVAAKVAL